MNPGAAGPLPDPSPRRSGSEESWYAGLVPGAAGGFLALEFPIAGVLVLIVALILIRLRGRAIAGAGGLLVGLGATWLLIFGRIAVTCGPSDDRSCFAPDIVPVVAVAATMLAIGSALSIYVAVRARRR